MPPLELPDLLEEPAKMEMTPGTCLPAEPSRMRAVCPRTQDESLSCESYIKLYQDDYLELLYDQFCRKTDLSVPPAPRSVPTETRSGQGLPVPPALEPLKGQLPPGTLAASWLHVLSLEPTYLACVTGVATYLWEHLGRDCPLQLMRSIRPSLVMDAFLVDHQAQFFHQQDWSYLHSQLSFQNICY